ncbi:EKC/KEOPS complex subunit LAGE3-like [Eumetopias jubatus]|uniref:EKC/KEOPS complex subunit LAGE3-like n=1 Tax=Eumetopias jubatus TaxID=34886 RepID=UPI001016704A|nr:EKC/KEOPS complex subunit LAGE3-like [Eumetopias jubatus]XP_027952394.1 EKC/KEOPS complex subunit LAGE3-like [Eumetopias jubatus]
MLAAGADAGAGGGAGGADHGRDGGACHGGRGCPRLPGGAGTVAAAALCRARPVSRPWHVPGPGGDAASTSLRLESRIHVFALCVPFPSSLEAEIAYRSLTPDAEPHRGAVEKQLTVSCSVVAVRWRGEDPRLLRISIISFLDQLSLVMQTMRRFGPPVSR